MGSWIQAPTHPHPPTHPPSGDDDGWHPAGGRRLGPREQAGGHVPGGAGQAARGRRGQLLRRVPRPIRQPGGSAGLQFSLPGFSFCLRMLLPGLCEPGVCVTAPQMLLPGLCVNQASVCEPGLCV